MKILITGIAGTGKTTALAELQKRGYVVIDLDATGMCRWRNKASNEIVEYGPIGRDYQWLTEHGWYCDIPMLKTLLSCIREDKDVFVAAIAENIEEMANEFDKILVFEADDEVLKDRLGKRSNNHFAKKEEEQNFIFEHSRELLKKIKDFMLVDANGNPSDIADGIISDLNK